MAPVCKKKIRDPQQKRLPHALSDLEVRHLLNCVTNPIHKTCLSIMYACGLRISEAVTLRVHSISRANMVLKIIGKGNKERHVPLPLPILRQLEDLWRSHRHPCWIFPNRDRSTHLSAATLSVSLAKAALAARMGGPNRPTSHALRHSFATRLLEKNVEVRIIQILLGHASIRSTSIYTHMTEPTRQSLRNILDNVMTGL